MKNQPGFTVRPPLPALPLAMLCALIMIATQPAQSQTFTVLYNFAGGASGEYPSTGLTLDRGGNLYGTTSGEFYATAGSGGLGNQTVSNYGTVFKLTHHGSGWVLSPLYTFLGTNGITPSSPLIFGPDGALYGTTEYGGQNDGGTVYVLRPQGTFCKSVLCPWNETVLYNFTGSTDSLAPQGNLAFDSSGNLYGTTAGEPPEFQGNVWELVHSGGTWIFNVLHEFSGEQGDGDGSSPLGGVIFNGENLYGTTVSGGSPYNAGAVFQLTPSGSGWTEQTLYSFGGAQGGAYPYAGLVADQLGNMYGATHLGSYAFELTPSGSGWNFAFIYELSSGNYGPASSLTVDVQGNVYGTIPTAGQNQMGTVFKLSQSNGVWTYTDLHDFTGESDGDGPTGSVILDANGNIYGTAYGGGANGFGTVWEITP